MEFWRYYRIIRRRRWLIILGMLICVGLVALLNQLEPPLYKGRTTLVETNASSRDVLLYSTDAYFSRTQQDVQLRLSNLGTIATSRSVMEDAARTLADLGCKYTWSEIQGNLKVAPVRDTNILAIEVTLEDPAEAKQAADVVASALKRAYDELNNTAVRQSREFIETQIESTRQSMVNAQDALRRFKEQNEIVDLGAQGGQEIGRLTSTKNELARAQADCGAYAASVKRLNEELSELPEWQEQSKQTSRDPVWQQLTQDLARLEAQKAAMTTGAPGQQRRLPNHPEVQAVQAQIDDVKTRLADIEKEYTSGVVVGRNQNRASAIDRYIVANVERVSAEARRSALQDVVEQVRSDLSMLPSKEAKLRELETDVLAATDTYSNMRKKLDEARIKEQQAQEDHALKTIDPAAVTLANQNPVMKLIAALILSPLLGIGLALLLHYTDNRIRTAQEAETLLGLPVHAAVPETRAHSLPRQRCPEVVSIAYQMLTSSLWIASQNDGVNSFALVSAEPDTGRSVTASNLAVALAREGARVILVDADFRQPSQHRFFGTDNKVGLANVLAGGAVLEDAATPVSGIPGLLVVSTGPVPANAVKLLKSPQMKEFVELAREAADFVIYDTPAGVAFPDPVLVAAQVGSAIVVHSAGRVSRGSEAEFRARLESVGVRLVGAVFNKVKREDSSGYYHYRRSYGDIAIDAPKREKKALKGGV